MAAGDLGGLCLTQLTKSKAGLDFLYKGKGEVVGEERAGISCYISCLDYNFFFASLQYKEYKIDSLAFISPLLHNTTRYVGKLGTTHNILFSLGVLIPTCLYPQAAKNNLATTKIP